MNTGCIVAFFLFGITVGAFAFNYCVNFIFGISPPWYINVIGVIGGEVTFPLAIVLWLLSLGGLHGPLIVR
jgi:hypothetical protein